MSQPLASLLNLSSWTSGSFTNVQIAIIVVVTSVLVRFGFPRRNNQPPAKMIRKVLEATKSSTKQKMVLVIRTDLKMTHGKIAAQCCHACLAAYQYALETCPNNVKQWERYGQAKIALKCKSEDDLLELQGLARSMSLPSESICDAGHTQLAPGTRTVLAIGPGPVHLIDQVTGHLKLY